MTTKEQQEIRYWPTVKGLLVLAQADEVGAVEWAEDNYPGGYAINGAGQPIRRPVDDPETRHLYRGGAS